MWIKGKKNKIVIVIISLILIMILLICYKISMEKVYYNMVAQFKDVAMKIKEDKLTEVVDRTIDEIEFERERKLRNHREIIDKIISALESKIICKDHVGSRVMENKIIDDDISLKYFEIDLASNKILKTNESDFRDINDLEDKLKEYNYYDTYIEDGIAVILALNEKDINDMVKTEMQNKVRDIKIKNGHSWIDEFIGLDSGEIFAKNLVNSEDVEKEGEYLLINEKDIKGTKYNKVMLENVIKDGYSVNKYYDLKKDSEEMQLKISYNKFYEPFNWIIGTGVYLDDIHNLIYNDFMRYKNKIEYQFKLITSIMILISIGAILSGGIIFNYYEYKKRNFLKKQNNIIKRHYAILENKNNQTSKVIHDFKNQLIVISGLLRENKNDEVLDFISKIDKDITSSQNIVISKNKVLDILLNEKLNLMKKKNISFTYSIGIDEFEYIDDKHITIIMGNILDNAIESAEKCEEKFVDLKIGEYKSNFYVIKLKNSCNKITKSRKGNLISRKIDKENHGYGMQNVKCTVEKYNGNINWDYNKENKVFTTVIVINKNKSL